MSNATVTRGRIELYERLANESLGDKKQQNLNEVARLKRQLKRELAPDFLEVERNYHSAEIAKLAEAVNEGRMGQEEFQRQQLYHAIAIRDIDNDIERQAEESESSMEDTISDETVVTDKAILTAFKIPIKDLLRWLEE